jgi:hypothetical protein
MRNFLAAVAVLAILAGVGFYAAGWLTYRKDDGGATVNIKTREVERAAERAVDKTKNLLDDVIDQPVHHVDPVPATPPVERQPVVPAQPEEVDGPVTFHATRAQLVA